MQLCENLYKLSGVDYRTNSNSYVVKCGDELVMIDPGFSEQQWNTIMNGLKEWGLDSYPITHTFLTHSHFDHSGNCFRVKELGSKLYVGPEDADEIENGFPPIIEKLFPGAVFTPTKVDVVVKDKDVFDINGTKFEIIHIPGHSPGSVAIKVYLKDKVAIALGDFLEIQPDPPHDDITIGLPFMPPGSDVKGYVNSLRRMNEEVADILLPGHYYVSFGKEDCANVLKVALDTALVELKERLEEE
ncbi:MAG: MBL fold metallo-hydrolase [Solobacterium sp.]|nr:MBL fold metallo-hydrolase [Solobacterium sp.]